MKEKIKKIKKIFINKLMKGSIKYTRKKKKKKEKKILTEELNIKSNSNCNYRKYIYTVTSILIIYFLLIIFAKPLQSILIFPEIYFNSVNLNKIRGEVVTVKGNFGGNINGAFIKGNSEKVIFYFYDSKKNYLEISKLNSLGYSVMFYDYKREIKNHKDFSIENLYDSSKTFYSHILNTRSIKKENIVIIGQGRGAILASDFAININIDKLILISPVSSFYDLAKDKIGFSFQKLLFLPNISSSKILRNYFNSILLINGNTNYKNNFLYSKSIFRRIDSDKKYFVELDNPLNKNILTNYDEVLDLLLSDFINTGILKNRYTFLDKSEVIRLIKENTHDNIYDSIDLETDISLTKFVNNKVAYNNYGYVPDDLVPVGGNHIIDSKGNIRVKKIMKDALQDLANNFYKDTENNIVVVSGYRSYLYQKGIKDRGCPDNLCAKAGYSEHQSGLAIDLYSASSNRNWANDNNLKKYYKWLSANAHKYGFLNTYQKGLDIDGYEIEPWHWRYVGVELASILKEKGITFAEFYNEKRSRGK